MSHNAYESKGELAAAVSLLLGMPRLATATLRSWKADGCPVPSGPPPFTRQQADSIAAWRRENEQMRGRPPSSINGIRRDRFPGVAHQAEDPGTSRLDHVECDSAVGATMAAIARIMESATELADLARISSNEEFRAELLKLAWPEGWTCAPWWHESEEP